MKITETDNEIILRDVPFGYWTIGCILTPVLGFIIIAMIAAATEDPSIIFRASDGGWLDSIMGILVSGFCFGFFMLIFAAVFSFLLTPVKTTKINRQTQRIEHKSRGLFKNKTQVFYFSQVKGFDSEKIVTRRSVAYFLVLVLANQKKIKLETGERTADENEEILQKLNSFIKAKTDGLLSQKYDDRTK